MTLRQRALLVAVLALLLADSGCSRSAADRPLPAVTVEAAYPGANAQVVADTVAAPIEQQINGVEKVVHMTSRSAEDGTYRLTVTFERGTDLDMAQVLVQNRVSLAEPILPDLVKRSGVMTRKTPAGLLMLVTVASPDNSRDTAWLSNYAATHVQDELARVPGVGDVVPFGESERRLTVWLDPDKLAARDLTAQEVIRALEQQDMRVAARAIGQPPAGKAGDSRFAVDILGRVADPDEVGKIVLKGGEGVPPIRLRDVARIESGATAELNWARLNGKPVVLLGLYLAPQARSRDVSTAAAARVAQLRANSPDGARLDVGFDFTPDVKAAGPSMAVDYLLLDPTLPPGTSVERTREVLGHCEALLRGVAGVNDVLALSGNPFDRRRDRPCLLVRLVPASAGQAGRQQIVQGVRDRLGQVEGVTLRLRDLSVPGALPRCGYPIDLALYGEEADRVREWATKVAERLAQSKKLTDVGTDPDAAPRPQLSVDVDRARAEALGVSLRDVMATLQASGWQTDNVVGGARQPWQVKLEAGANGGDWVGDLQRLKVRNAQGEMVPLSAFLQVREVSAPEAVNRFNLFPAVEITANPAPGVSPAEARTLCETLAEEVRKELALPAGYRLGWLN